MATLRVLTPPAVFAVSLPIALIHPYAAIVTWFAVHPIVQILLRVERAPRPSKEHARTAPAAPPDGGRVRTEH